MAADRATRVADSPISPPRRRRPLWRDLAPGLTALAVLGIATAVVLIFARPGAMHGTTFPLHVTFATAPGVATGTAVWLAGQEVGRVERVTFRPPTALRSERLVVELRIRERYRGQIRRDTRAAIEAGGGVLGEPVLYLTPGSIAAEPVGNGDTLVGTASVDRQALVGDLRGAGAQLPELLAEVRGLADQLKSEDGSVGAAVRGSGETRAALATTRLELRRLAAAVRGSDAAGAELRRLRARASVARARADSVRRLLDSPVGTIGRFRKDSTLALRLAEVRAEVGALRAEAERPDGTIGRLRSDGVLARELAALEAELDRLLRDVKSNPLRYVNF